MTTITLKVNERSKAGKAFMSMTDFFIESKSIKVIDNKNSATDFYSEMENAFAEIKQIEMGNKKAKTLKELLNE
jgi:hypothetical protein